MVALLALAALSWLAARSSFHYAIHTLDADARNLALTRQLGADTIVQLFSWRQIEPTRDQYHWQFPDEVVQGAEFYGLDLVVRIDQHPAWASSATTEVDAPPDNPADYALFVKTVAQRYRGRVLGYIIWNEPNLAREWGGRSPDPGAYVNLLRVAHQAIKEADPGALVVSAGLAPNNDRTATALDDRVYLQEMYAAGAAPYFDVLGAHPYGFAYSPDDPHGAHDGFNLARLLDLRDIMVRNGDRAKAVWATELGWTTEATGAAAWQQVTPAQQAEFLTGAYRRARREWPWLKMIAVWNLGGQDHAEWRGYSLLDAGGRPRPAFDAFRRLAAGTARLRPARIASMARTLTSRLSAPSRYPVLAADAVIHLGDSEFSQPWMPLYGDRNPSTAWEGTVWVGDPGSGAWYLTLRLMQGNVWGNQVWVNGRSLEPAFPPEDFTGAWVSWRARVPAGLLRPGPNQVRVTISRTLPLVQVNRFAWDDLQIKDVVLARENVD
jgi:polysaccharide biosynthesis protein PslG